ncbi:hypothetical protein J2045_000530 [Peteryoungia aggregata LMG 23059]|uniref:PA14 domain-containing protein n=1 Tax=Peteryoungia aggregata LMG 23059 TaxID=1368425 RepID=A0ABU0G2F3_9HYPH|nr:hypothetical protein [Peteryoungia aggregata]MDQ0419520.1 hypothetical protein [Peteryoungia aggregata LMG 23059]
MKHALATDADKASKGFLVETGEAITAWAMGEITQTLYPGEPELAEDRVNYRFVNGFVDVGDLPCRLALWKHVAARTVALTADFPISALYLPGFNRRVEFSGFWHRPTLLARWLRTRIVPPVSGRYRLRLATCGGVHLWVDGALAAKFEPFRRNKESVTEIELWLEAGGSEIVVLAEELAERDALWYFELTVLDAVPLRIELPVDVSVETIEVLKALARDVRPSPMHVRDGELVLEFGTPASVDVEIRAQILPSVHMRGKPPLLDARAVLSAGERRVTLEGVWTLPDAYHALDLTLSVGETRVERQIAFARFRDPPRDMRHLPLAQRKAIALEYMAEHGELRAGRAVAALAHGLPVGATFREIVDNTLAAIDERRDCSDFVMVPLLWAAACYAAQIPGDIMAKIEHSILGYRYWVDEPGNDVMWFWSENHVLCFHVSQYLAGRLYPDHRFECSGRLGAAQADLACDRLMHWFDSVEVHGLAEWNSAAYYPIDFIGLLALEHLGQGAVRDRARTLLDRLFVMIGLHTLAGVPAGTMGRAYDKELRAGPLTELAPFATVGFGEGWLNDGVAALPMLAAGDYSPPVAAAEVVTPPAGEAITAHYVQGHDEAARLVLYKTAAVQLSSTMDGKPGGRGHQQHILDIRFAAHPLARAWVNHPGEDDPWGHQRPSYWAGNGSMPRAAQFQNSALLLYDLGVDARLPFTHGYVECQAFDEVVLENNWIMLRSGAGLAALTATRTIVPVDTGPCAGIEFRAEGTNSAWYVVVADAADAGNLQSFRNLLAQTRVELSDDGRRVSVRQPQGPSLVLDWLDGLSVDGQPHLFPNRSIDPMIQRIDAASF